MLGKELGGTQAKRMRKMKSGVEAIAKTAAESDPKPSASLAAGRAETMSQSEARESSSADLVGVQLHNGCISCASSVLK